MPRGQSGNHAFWATPSASTTGMSTKLSTAPRELRQDVPRVLNVGRDPDRATVRPLDRVSCRRKELVFQAKMTQSRAGSAAIALACHRQDYRNQLALQARDPRDLGA